MREIDDARIVGFPYWAERDAFKCKLSGCSVCVRGSQRAEGWEGNKITW